MSEGYTIYNGKPSDVLDYFKEFGLKFSKHTNPADKLSMIASEPLKYLNCKATIENLAFHCQVKQPENL